MSFDAIEVMFQLAYSSDRDVISKNAEKLLSDCHCCITNNFYD